MRNILLIGSTGSIGQSTIEVIKHHNNRLRLVAICARSYSDQLLQQIKDLNPQYTIITDSVARSKLQGEGLDIRDSGLLFELVRSDKIDTLVFAKSGIDLVELIFAAIKTNKRICLATKEIIVGFGNLINEELDRNHAELLPIDSEHAALHQCLDRRRTSDIRRIILTASGGPFFDREDLSDVTVSETLKHPVWSMGKKITVDSATLMNKGLELIEAHHLFRVPPEKIGAIIHPQCIIHSFIEFHDYSMLAQLSIPDMKLPIQYALLYPERLPSLVEPVDLTEIEAMDFHKPQPDKFPCLDLAHQVMKEGGTKPVVLVSADDMAVEIFLKNKIRLTQIPELIAMALDDHKNIESPGLEEIKEAARWAKDYVKEKCSSL